MRGFQNGLIFKILPSGSRDILILVLQKKGFFSQDLDIRELRYISEMAPKRFFKGFLQFSGINTLNFVKNDPKFENKSLFDAEFYEA